MHRLGVLAAAAAACVTPRTTAASQPTPAAFDAAGSDPRALALVDAALDAMGGRARYDAIEELRFELRYYDGPLRGWFRHRWDRWNGRDQFSTADPATFGAPPAQVGWLTVTYDVYNASVLPFGTYLDEPMEDEQAAKNVPIARAHLDRDPYFLLFPYKLRDPGVHLRYDGVPLEIVGAEDLCKPSCERVVVTFDPDVGGDTWLVAFNAVTHLPQMIQKQVDGGRVGYRLDAWIRVDGLAFATRITNIARPTEIYEYADVGVGVPRDETYAPAIDRGQKIDSCNPRPGARSKHRGCNF